MPVLAVIPARLGATRLPRKPLRLLGGQPLVTRVFERVVAMNLVDRCVVATDSSEVLDACAAHGIPAVMTREDHPSGTDRIAEVASMPTFESFDVILNVQGDEPFISREAVLGAVEIVKAGRAPIGTVAVPADAASLGRFDVVKVVCADNGNALYFSRAPIPFLRDTRDRTVLKSLVLQHLGVYAYSRAALHQWVDWPVHPLEQVERLEQLRPLAHGLAIGVATISTPAERGIDTEEDLVRANAFWDSDMMSNTDSRSTRFST